MISFFKDNVTGKSSAGRLVYILGFFVSSAILLKMVILHQQFSDLMWIGWLAYCLGHTIFEKFLEVMKH